MPTEVEAVPVDDGGYDGSVQGWDGQIARLTQGLALTKGAGSAVRAGVLAGVGGALGYTLSGLNGTLQPGIVIIPASTGAQYGAHPLWRDTAAILNHATADVSQPRTDLIIGEVQDFGGSVPVVRRFRILTGTPAASAPTPTLTAAVGNGGWIALHSVRIAAGATTGVVTDLRTYTAAAGGLVPLPGAMTGTASADDTRRAALAAALPPGTPWVDVTNRCQGLVLNGQLHPTTSRILYQETRSNTASVQDTQVVMTGQSITFTGTRLIRVTIGAFAEAYGPNTSKIAVRLWCTPFPLDVTDQGLPGKPFEGGKIQLNASGEFPMSGTVLFSVSALTEPFLTGQAVNLDNIRITVTDLGPA